MNAIKGITFEKDAKGNNRYVRIDMLRHAQVLHPLLQQLGILQHLDGWEDGLTSEEFLLESKAMLQKKFDARNKIS